METRLLGSLGKVAGIGGIALGVVLLLLKDFLKQKFLSVAGLDANQGFHIMLAFLIFTFGIAGIGLVAWLIGHGTPPGSPAPTRALALLVFLIIVVLASATLAGITGTSRPDQTNENKEPDRTKNDTVQFKPFGDTVSLSERDAENTHGLTLRSGSIGVDAEGAWAEVAVTVNGDTQGGDRYRKGDYIHLSSPDCQSLSVYIKDVNLSKDPSLSDEQLQEMGPAAEAYVHRHVVLLVSGQCRPAISDAPRAESKQPSAESGASPSPPETSQHQGVDCVVNKFRSFLGPGVTVADLKPEYYQTMLPEASEKGDYACVSAIIAKGAKLNEATPMSPLMWAAKSRHADIVNLLLQHGATVDLTSPTGNTALSFAADSHSLPTIKVLVDHGADVNFPTTFTPLMNGAYSGDLTIVNYLLTKGADPCKKSEHGETAADVAHRQNHKEVETRLRSFLCSS